MPDNNYTAWIAGPKGCHWRLASAYAWIAGPKVMFCALVACLAVVAGCSEEGQPSSASPVARSNNAAAPATDSETPKKAEPPAKSAPSAAKKPVKPADNSACMVCHADFEKEPLAAAHQKAGIGCSKCHGESGDHGGDELNIMLPDVMFGRKEIEPFCTGCHEKKDHPKGKEYLRFLKKWRDKYRPNGRIVQDKSICTDCHGNHAVLTPAQMQFPAE